MATNEDEVRHLVAQLREAFDNDDDAEVDRLVALLEAAVAEWKSAEAETEPPETQPPEVQRPDD